MNERLYDAEVLPLYVRDGRIEPADWERIRRRAEEAPPT